MTASQFSTPAVESTASDFATFGAVHLDVTDVERALGFWRDLVGLAVLGRDEDGVRLGVGERALVVLHPGAHGPVVREASGLYHLSFHLPSLADFARAFARIEAADYFQFPTDHGTHLANYVDDPDGIGLEFAFETPAEVRAGWEDVPGFEQGEHGRHWGGRDPRYLAWLAAQVPDGDTRPGLPAGAIVGHMHLRVADTAAALPFYRDAIGFTANRDGSPGAMFDLSAGGTFPHRLACNTWESAGLPQRPAEAAGMRHFTLHLRSQGDLAATIARVEAAGQQPERRGGDALVADPSGTRLLLTSPAAR
ncbi:MAG TPA: VOC family protein [Thermomicrobiales bacterium]|nr:VOC family protein [Thermomicrobiales bacterium]